MVNSREKFSNCRYFFKVLLSDLKEELIFFLYNPLMTIPIIFMLLSPSGEFVVGRQRRVQDHSVYPECTPAPWW